MTYYRSRIILQDFCLSRTMNRRTRMCWFNAEEKASVSTAIDKWDGDDLDSFKVEFAKIYALLEQESKNQYVERTERYF